MGDNAYEERVDNVVETLMNMNPDGIPNKEIESKLLFVCEGMLEFRLGGKAWKDFAGDVKKKLVPLLKEAKAEKKKDA
jgi:hypothetical protein